MTTVSKGAPNGEPHGDENQGTEVQKAAKPHITSFIEAGCALALVAITFTYTYYASGQLHKMKRTVDAAEKASAIAEQTLRNQQTTFEMDKRAYLIGLSPVFAKPGFVAEQPLFINISVKNVGATPAIRQVSQLRLIPHRIHAPTGEAAALDVQSFLQANFQEMKTHDIEVRKELDRIPEAEDDVAPNADFFTSNFAKPEAKLSGNEFKEISVMNPKALFFLYALGYVTYYDAFYHPHQSEICWFFVGNDPAIWHRCALHNTIR